jgi:hypothetical protein
MIAAILVGLLFFALMAVAPLVNSPQYGIVPVVPTTYGYPSATP